jgi:hypothetical protein
VGLQKEEWRFLVFSVGRGFWRLGEVVVEDDGEGGEGWFEGFCILFLIPNVTDGLEGIVVVVEGEERVVVGDPMVWFRRV